MSRYVELYLAKGEDEQAYKKQAESGMDLMYRVKIHGKTHRSDINVPYHTSIKVFNTQHDTPEQAHHIASKLPLHAPNAKEVGITPTTLQGRTGYTMHVLRLHGPHADKIKEHHKHFAHMGVKENYDFHPHITVDKDTWHKIKNAGHKTAHEAGIEFGHAVLQHKDKDVKHYGPQTAPIKKSEENDLQKGAIKNTLVGLGTMAALAGAPAQAPAQSQAHASVLPAQQHIHPQLPKYDRGRMMRTIASVESSGGVATEHKPLKSGEVAYGKYALTPNVIRETIHMHRDLNLKHKKATMLHGQDLHHYMQDNPGLEDTIAQRHLKRLEHHFGPNPDKLGYAWLEGITGTYHAIKNKTPIENHWHVKKIKEAYSKGEH